LLLAFGVPNIEDTRFGSIVMDWVVVLMERDWQNVVDFVARRETEKGSKIYEVYLPSIGESQHCTIDLPVVTVI
jgi:hypothetical protein